MRKRLTAAVLIGLTAFTFVGCDMMMPDDVADAQDEMRRNRPLPAAHELPPGLGEDLPMATTAPLVRDK